MCLSTLEPYPAQVNSLGGAVLQQALSNSGQQSGAQLALANYLAHGSNSDKEPHTELRALTRMCFPTDGGVDRPSLRPGIGCAHITQTSVIQRTPPRRCEQVISVRRAPRPEPGGFGREDAASKPCLKMPQLSAMIPPPTGGRPQLLHSPTEVVVSCPLPSACRYDSATSDTTHLRMLFAVSMPAVNVRVAAILTNCEPRVVVGCVP